MLPKVAVVVPRSPSKEIRCWKCQAVTKAAPFCPGCGVLQDLPEFLNFFEILSVPPLLGLDETELRTRFYALSKKTHPDRYTQAPAPEPSYAMRWNTALNKAFQTLRDPVKRAYYLLELFLPTPAKSTQVPLDLAEAYFELQDLLTEPEGREKMAAFRTDLENQLGSQANEWTSLEKKWSESTDPRPLATDLEKFLVKQKYLKSMISDLIKN